MEYDGSVDYQLTLRYIKSFKVKYIRLEIPINKENVEYMMGLNHEGGFKISE